MSYEMRSKDAVFREGPSGYDVEGLRSDALTPISTVEPVKGFRPPKLWFEKDTDLADAKVSRRQRDGKAAQALRPAPQPLLDPLHSLDFGHRIGHEGEAWMSGSWHDSAMTEASSIRNGRRLTRGPVSGASGTGISTTTPICHSSSPGELCAFPARPLSEPGRQTPIANCSARDSLLAAVPRHRRNGGAAHVGSASRMHSLVRSVVRSRGNLVPCNYS